MNPPNLWDVLKSCVRDGSLDSKIRDEKPNDFHAFLKRYSNIRHIFFNGEKAETFFKRYVNQSLGQVKLHAPLCSTSIANRKALFEKVQDWKRICTYL